MESALKADGVSYDIEHVPQYLDRDASEDFRDMVGWRLTLTRGTYSVAFRYWYGLGHVPGYSELVRQRPTLHNKLLLTNLRRDALERGIVNRAPLPTPHVADILASLVLELQSAACSTFEQWADDMGMSGDSIRAQRCYLKVVENSARLRSILSEAALSTLTELEHEL